ncbi:MAG: chemotaxis protein CheW [Nitrospira sp.]|nr:chemotaxis protein CheW [Nitrospira sp.]
MPGDLCLTREEAACSVSPSCDDSNRDQWCSLSRWCLLPIGHDVFAVHLHHVREVVQVESIVPVPGLPPVLVGVTICGGLVIPLMDVSILLDRSRTIRRRYAALVKQEEKVIGILLDGIPEISTGSFGVAHQHTIDESSKVGVVLSGVINNGSEQYHLLDVPKLFAVLQSLSVHSSPASVDKGPL